MREIGVIPAFDVLYMWVLFASQVSLVVQTGLWSKTINRERGTIKASKPITCEAEKDAMYVYKI